MGSAGKSSKNIDEYIEANKVRDQDSKDYTYEYLNESNIERIEKISVKRESNKIIDRVIDTEKPISTQNEKSAYKPVICVLGKTGCGKSTFCHLISGSDPRVNK